MGLDLHVIEPAGAHSRVRAWPVTARAWAQSTELELSPRVGGVELVPVTTFRPGSELLPPPGRGQGKAEDWAQDWFELISSQDNSLVHMGTQGACT